MKVLICPCCGSKKCDYNFCDGDYHCIECNHVFEIDDQVIGVPPTNDDEDTEIIDLLSTMKEDAHAKTPEQLRQDEELDELFWAIVKKNS
jgi:hypothetical protein